MSPYVRATEDPEALRRQVADLEAEVARYQAAVKAVRHRVKNQLQVVSSLLHLQSAQTRDPVGRAALASSEYRVKALALVHDALYRSADMGRVDLEPHLEVLCAQLARSRHMDPAHVQVTVRAGAAEIDLDRAVSVTLLVHELVSNALRHAFPGGRPGTVSVTAERDPDGRYVLAVADDGVGLPTGLAFGQARTPGLQLVAALAQQLGGSVSVDRAAGTTIRVTLPDQPHTAGTP